MSQWTLGNRVAPARFVIFFVMLGASIALATTIAPWWRSVMLGFDLSSLVFMFSCLKLLQAEPGQMRKVAGANDANRSVLLFLAFALATVILIVVGSEMALAKITSALDKATTIGTLLIAWFFANTVYALHYSHLGTHINVSLAPVEA